MKKQIILSTAYFITCFVVLGIFDMFLYPLFPSNLVLITYTWLDVFQASAIITITLTYGDHREQKGILKANES